MIEMGECIGGQWLNVYIGEALVPQLNTLPNPSYWLSASASQHGAIYGMGRRVKDTTIKHAVLNKPMCLASDSPHSGT